MPKNRDDEHVRSTSLPIYTQESVRHRLHDNRLSETERRQTKVHLKALQRRERDLSRKLQHQREAEKERLEARRQHAADQRAATTWTPTWDQPIHEPPVAEPWAQDDAYLDPITDDQNKGR